MGLFIAWAIEPALYLGAALLIARYGFRIRSISRGTHHFLLLLFAVAAMFPVAISPIPAFGSACGVH